MSAETWAAIVSALVSILSAAISVIYSQRSLQHSRDLSQQEWLDQMREWADHTVELTSMISHLLSANAWTSATLEAKLNIQAKLSAQIDKGRWYFPNLLTDTAGTWKDYAFKGIRQPILDSLVDIYDLLCEENAADAEASASKVRVAHRAIVSVVQERLSPQKRDQTYADIVKRYSSNSEYIASGLSRLSTTSADSAVGVPPAAERQGEQQAPN